jgi:hypothetical protein
MSFLFGKKKPGQREGPGPQSSQVVSGGPTPTPTPPEKERQERMGRTPGGPPSSIPTPASQPGHATGSMNNSINSLGGGSGPNTDPVLAARPRPDAENQVCPRQAERGNRARKLDSGCYLEHWLMI